MNENRETASAGNKIHRHAEEGSDAVGSIARARHAQQISAHVTRYLGAIDRVIAEPESDPAHVDISHIKPTAEWPYHRLVTTGMSDLPMSVPAESEATPYLELMLTLPIDWRVDNEALKDEHWSWPIRQLKFLALFPRNYDTWLGYGHTIPNGDPAEPYSATCRFSGVIVLPSVTVDTEFHSLALEDGSTVQFMSMIPVYSAEMDLKLTQGSTELITRFDKREVTDIVDVNRPDVARKRFWLF